MTRETAVGYAYASRFQPGPPVRHLIVPSAPGTWLLRCSGGRALRSPEGTAVTCPKCRREARS